MPASTHLVPDRELEEAEIEVLNEIVLRASHSSDSDIYTWRSVYRAYKDVLQEHGLDEDQDSVYLRFLLLLRERQVVNPIPSLDAHFIQLLLDNGIVLRRTESDIFSEEDSRFGLEPASSSRDDEPRNLAGGIEGDHSDVTIALERFGRPLDEITRAARRWVPPPPRQRRASLTSLKDDFNLVLEMKEAPRRASFSQVEEETGRISHLNERLPMPEATRSEAWQSSMIANASSPSELPPRSTRPLSQITLLDEPEDWGLYEKKLPWRVVEKAAHEAQTVRKVARGQKTQPSRYATLESNSALAPMPRPQGQTRDMLDKELVVKTAQLGLESASFGLRGTALAFDAARAQGLSRRILLHWYQQTYNTLMRQHELDDKAIKWDADQLQRDSFRIWYQAARNIGDFRAEQLAEEHRCRKLEQKAEDAQQIRLLAKAFHHWAACTADENERVKQAKQHLLRLRYFEAWREHAIATEISTRRICLSKWLKKWRDHRCVNDRIHASVMSSGNKLLLHRLFSGWLLEARLREHSRSKCLELKQRLFDKLTIKFRNIIQAQCIVTDARQRAAVLLIQNKLGERHEAAKHAVLHDCERILRQGFRQIVKQQRVSAQGREVASQVDWRVAHSAMSKLRYQLFLGKQAKCIDRDRLYRDIWHIWSSRLRQQAIQKRASSRLRAQCLYRWVLAERCRLFERLHAERLLHRCLVKVVGHWSNHSEDLAESYIACKKAQKQGLTRSAFERLRQMTNRITRLRGVAVATDERRLLETAFDTFVVRMERIQLIESEYLPNANLWFVGTSALKKWKAATLSARIRRRHESYVVVRRLVKQNVARKFLLQWRERTRFINIESQRGIDIRGQALVSLATDLFLDWKERWQFLNELERRAIAERSTKLEHSALIRWRSKGDRVQENTSIALDRDAEYTKRAAYVCLRRLHFRISGIQDLYNSRRVTDVIEWSRRRHCRYLVRVWLEASLRKRGLLHLDTSATGRARRFRGLLGQSQFKEDRSAHHNAAHNYEDDGMTPGLPPPITPSRRRFARSTRTPAPARSSLVLPDGLPVRTVPNRAETNPFTIPASVSTELDRAQNRPFGRSAARVLFKPLPERASDSFP